MATGKRFYWIKLKKEFLTGDVVDFLMAQKDGSNYVVLYLMLCLMCLNTNGTMANQIGEVIVPFDADKITRDCKHFSRDTVIVGLELFKKLGLIYEQEDGILAISDYSSFIGSETDYAAKKRELRSEKRCEIETMSPLCLETVSENVHTEIRDKSLEIREQSLEKRDKSLEKDTIYMDSVREIIDHLNLIVGSKYKPTTDVNKKHIIARLKDGFEIGDFFIVIDRMYERWGNDPKMSQYLRPQTLFGPKFESYLNMEGPMTEEEKRKNEWIQA